MNQSSETRRALVRKYKESPPPAGVFVVRNQQSGRVYVAGGLDVDGAMNRARFELKLRSHRNKPLQADWSALGADNFSIELVDRVKERAEPDFDRPAALAKLLALWQEELQCFSERGYNKP